MQADLTSFSDAAEHNIRFLAMLAGPFYPILHIVNERLVCAPRYISRVIFPYPVQYVLCGCFLADMNIVLSELLHRSAIVDEYSITVI